MKKKNKKYKEFRFQDKIFSIIYKIFDLIDKEVRIEKREKRLKNN